MSRNDNITFFPLYFLSILQSLAPSLWKWFQRFSLFRFISVDALTLLISSGTFLMEHFLGGDKNWLLMVFCLYRFYKDWNEHHLKVYWIYRAFESKNIKDLQLHWTIFRLILRQHLVFSGKINYFLTTWSPFLIILMNGWWSGSQKRFRLQTFSALCELSTGSFSNYFFKRSTKKLKFNYRRKFIQWWQQEKNQKLKDR